MCEVMVYVSSVMMWIATGLNMYSFILQIRARKHYKKKEKELDATEKYYNTMIAACTEFLEAAHKESEEAMNGLD